jgi:ferredoxin-thioredoxin reductase catalytic subunit
MITSVEKIMKFIDEHGFKLSPYFKLEEKIGMMIEKGHCLCDVTRPECPCWQSEIEVKKTGRCKCTMMLSREYYEWMMKRKAKHEKTGKWSNEMFVPRGE